MNPFFSLFRDFNPRRQPIPWGRVLGFVIILVGVPLGWFGLIEAVRWLWAHL